jgi:hypothetical protein
LQGGPRQFPGPDHARNVLDLDVDVLSQRAPVEPSALRFDHHGCSVSAALDLAEELRGMVLKFGR